MTLNHVIATNGAMAASVKRKILEICYESMGNFMVSENPQSSGDDVANGFPPNNGDFISDGGLNSSKTY